MVNQMLYRMIAQAEVVSVVKGECPEKISIGFYYPEKISKLVTMMRIKYPRIASFVFPYPKGPRTGLGSVSWELCAKLSEGETALVFLKKSDDRYELGRIQSKARVSAEKVAYDLGQTLTLRLLAEFIAGGRSDDEMVRLQAAEELGYIAEELIDSLGKVRSEQQLFGETVRGLKAAQKALAELRSDADLVVSSAALISSFQADDSPGIEQPLELLSMAVERFGPGDSLAKYGIPDFSAAVLQLRLLETMDSTTRRSVHDLTDGSVIMWPDGRPGIYRGVRGFDYPAFYRRALECAVVKDSADMRSAIANVIWIRCDADSVAEMVSLLDDSNAYVRFVAVGALSKYTGQGPQEQTWEQFKEDDGKCVEYWKDWWRENKDKYAPPADGGTDK